MYTSVQDSAKLIPSGYNSNAGVSVWSRGGKQLVSLLSCLSISLL